MPVTLADLKRNVRTIPVEYGGLTIHISYRPSEITPTLGQEMVAHDTPLVLALERVLAGWDIVESDDNPTPLPITAEVLGGPGLGTPLLSRMWGAISEDMFVPNPSGATSDVG